MIGCDSVSILDRRVSARAIRCPAVGLWNREMLTVEVKLWQPFSDLLEAAAEVPKKFRQLRKFGKMPVLVRDGPKRQILRVNRKLINYSTGFKYRETNQGDWGAR